MTICSTKIRLLAVMEANSVTGPARNLIAFCQHARDARTLSPDLPVIESSIATYHRDPKWQCDPEQLPLSNLNPFLNAVRTAGIEIDVIGERYRYDPRVLSHLRRIVAQRSPDILQTHNVKSHLLTRLAGLQRSRPWIAFHHGYTSTNRMDQVYNQLNRWSLRAAQCVITVSEAFARQLEQTGVAPERIRVVHNAVYPRQSAELTQSELDAVRAEAGMAHDERIVLAVGRLSYEKGHADLIAALARLHSDCPGNKVRLLLVGDGPERERLVNMAAALGIAKWVTFLGHQKDVSAFYAMADVMALPSHSEGSPNVLLEGMAAELPIVATAVGGIPEIVTHQESALLIPPRDAGAMAEALGRVLSDSLLARTLSRTARREAVCRYSPEARLRSLIAIYCETASLSAVVKGREKR